MEHLQGSDMRWSPGSADTFTGGVRSVTMASPMRDGGLTTLGVIFDPGARTAWHSHPEGQVLYVAFGAGLVANDGGERVAVAAGDVVVTQPGEVHWHGASPHVHMMHLSLTTGGPAEWREKVTDEEYESGP